MGDDDDQTAPDDAMSETPGGLPDRISETVVGLATGVPPQIQRSFFKAFGRVFTAGAEWPARYLEGRGKVASARADLEAARYRSEAADIASEQKARDVVNRGSAKAAVTQFQKEDMAQRAADFHAAHILREQSIREDVLEHTANNLRDNPPTSDSSSDIDDDWLTAFFKEASTRSSEEYKALFSRILSGEIRSPGSFSIGTVQSISRMDQGTASIFQNACNLSLSIVGTTSCRIVSDNFLPIGDNQLTKHGMSYNDFSLLVEQGLLRSELSENNTIKDDVLRIGLIIDIGGVLYCIKRSAAQIAAGISNSILLQGPSFSIAGQQLRTVVTMNPTESYLKDLSKYINDNNAELYIAHKIDAGYALIALVPFE